MSSFETWVCTLVVAFHEFASYRLQTMRLSPGVGVTFTHTGQSLLKNGSQPTVGDLKLIEDVSLDSFACNFDDHPVTRRDEGNITAVDLAAVHHELAVDPLLRFVDFAMEKHWRSSDAVHQLQGLLN